MYSGVNRSTLCWLKRATERNSPYIASLTVCFAGGIDFYSRSHWLGELGLSKYRCYTNKAKCCVYFVPSVLCPVLPMSFQLLISCILKFVYTVCMTESQWSLTRCCNNRLDTDNSASALPNMGRGFLMERWQWVRPCPCKKFPRFWGSSGWSMHEISLEALVL